MKIVAIANQKGGVGKTTTSLNLASCLAELGHDTLLVDLDPQANATSALGHEITEGRSLYPVLMGERALADGVVPTAYPHLFLVPAEMDLAGCEVEIARQDNHLTRLRTICDAYRSVGKVKYVLLDCPPSLGILMTNALAAADSILIPLQCEFFALEGLAKILQVIEQIKTATNSANPALEGIVMTMYDARTNLSQQVVNEVRGHFGAKVFGTMIPRTIRLGEAPSHGKPINYYDPAGIGTQSYRALAQEFVSRQSH